MEAYYDGLLPEWSFGNEEKLKKMTLEVVSPKEA